MSLRGVDCARLLIRATKRRDAAGALGSQNRGAAAAERVEDDPVAPAAVADQIGDEGDGLYGGVQLELAPPGRVQAVDARTVEHVAAMAAFGAEAEIVDVQCGAVLEDADQLVLRAIEGALPGVALVPDQQVLPLGVERPSGSQQLGEVPPIDEQVMDRSVDAEGDGVADEAREKGGVGLLRHLSRGHREFAMAGL